MSETAAAPVESAPATESAPQSTQEIASSVIQSAESQATTDADIAASQEPAQPTQQQEPPPLSAAAQFLLSQGHREINGRGGNTWLPFKTVEGMLDRYVKESSKPWETEKTTLSKERDEARAAVQEYLTALRGDPVAFLREIAQHDTRYSSFLQPSAPAQPERPMDARPEPDVDLGDGRKTYSLDGIDKLLEWKTAQVEKRFEEKLKPLAEREKDAKERAEAEKSHQQLVDKTRAQIESAKTWPNWTEYEPAILTKLQEDSAKAQAENRRPTMTLREAYLEVQAEYLSKSDTEKRARWMEEANKAAKSTAVTRSGVEHTVKPGPRTTVDITRQVIAQAEASGQ